MQFVAKLNSSGNGLIYATYLGGTSFAHGNVIRVDSRGNAYVLGSLNSAGFPSHLAHIKPLSTQDFPGFLRSFMPRRQPWSTRSIFPPIRIRQQSWTSIRRATLISVAKLDPVSVLL